MVLTRMLAMMAGVLVGGLTRLAMWVLVGLPVIMVVTIRVVVRVMIRLVVLTSGGLARLIVVMA